MIYPPKIPHIFYWAKDINLRFIGCSENFAEAAGADSPQQLLGKTDYDVCWRNRANLYRATDHYALKGNQYLNAPEPLRTINQELDMLVTKCQLLNERGECIGIVGSNVDISGYCLLKKSGHYDPTENVFYLGGNFGREYLTKREIDILKHLLLGHTAKKIALQLKISFRTVEGFINKLKIKLQCSSKGDIIATAIKHGLTHLLIEDSFLMKQEQETVNFNDSTQSISILD